MIILLKSGLLAFGRWLLASPIGRAVGLVGLALAALGGAFLKGRAAGRAGERELQARRTAAAAARARRIEDTVSARTEAENRERLKRWSR